MYLSTKTYGHEEGLSCSFRQPNATHSHCSLIHGYALSFKFIFVAQDLDDKNWAVDFGGLKELKAWLKDNFDHVLAVDHADPRKDELLQLGYSGLAKTRTWYGVGCEMFAKHAFDFADKLIQEKTGGRCFVQSVEVREHGANSAIYVRD